MGQASHATGWLVTPTGYPLVTTRWGNHGRDLLLSQARRVRHLGDSEANELPRAHTNTGSATFGYQAHSSAVPTRGPEPDQQSHQIAVDANWLCGHQHTRGGIKDTTCRSVRLAGQDTSTTQKPTSRHVLSRTQRLLHSGVNSHSSSCTTLCCLHRKGRDGLNTELPAIGHTTLSILAKHHVGRSHIITLSGTVKNTTQASVSFIAR